MSTNQEFRHFNQKEAHNPGGTAVKLEEDHLLGMRAGGAQSSGTFNETRLDWINKTIPGTYANLCDAMAAFGEQNGVASWDAIGGKNTDEAPLLRQGSVTESGTVVALLFNEDVSTGAGTEANGWTVEIGETPAVQGSLSGGTIINNQLRLTLEGVVIERGERPIKVSYSKSAGSLKGGTGIAVADIFGFEVVNGSQQGAFSAGFDSGFS